MVSLVEQDKFSKTLSFMGTSTDEKPTDVFNFGQAVIPVVNGSAFYEIDTGDLFIFDEDEQGWVKQIVSGGGGGGYPEPTGTVTITTNGTKNVKNYAQAVVNVPQGVFPEGTLNIAANGSYNVSDKASVEVDVPNPSTGTINITSNGTYDVSEKASAEVAVPDTAQGIIERSIEGVYSNPAITDVGSYAFYGCKKLTKVVLDNALEVGEGSFVGCTVLSEASFATAEDVFIAAFTDCTTLTKVNISEVAIVYDNAFKGCSSLSQLVANNLREIKSQAFQGCSALSSIDLSKVTRIGYLGLGSTRIVKAELPLLENLDSYAFSNCSALTSVDIGEGCALLQASTFQNCSALNTLILRKNGLVSLSARSALSGTAIEGGNGYIYVPDDYVDGYKTATNWVYFTNQIKPLSELPS